MAFYAVFENEYGTIQFGGGDAPVYRTVDITGLGLPVREYNVVSYAGEAGQVTQAVRDTARTITINADVIRPNQLQQELGKTLRVLYHPGELRIQSGMKQRRIACRCTDMDDIARKGRDMANITLQFTCDSPYFTDYRAISLALFQRENVWEADFTLPTVFTKRDSEMDVVNGGDIKSEPIFTIYCKEADDTQADSAEEAAAQSTSQPYLLLENEATGQFIRLDYLPEAGEVITVDISGRTVRNDDGANLITSLSEDSFLNQFWLEPGPNHIKVSNETGRDVGVEIEFYNQYVEAVY